MTDQNQAQTPSARVTIDDVRTAIDSTDPNQTNASKVRALLGNRGSFETIQKHLATIRQELAIAAALPVSIDTVPALPAEAAQAIWVAAWTAAQVQTMARSEKLATERDAAFLKLETMGQDVAGFVATVDAQAVQLDQAAEAIAVAKVAHLADLDRAQSDQTKASEDFAQLTKENERIRNELIQEKAAASHAAELAESGRLMMREELERLTDQVGELKAHLYKRADSALVPPSPFPAGQ